jgi:hypothetical protein
MATGQWSRAGRRLEAATASPGPAAHLRHTYAVVGAVDRATPEHDPHPGTRQVIATRHLPSRGRQLRRPNPSTSPMSATRLAFRARATRRSTRAPAQKISSALSSDRVDQASTCASHRRRRESGR